MNTLHPLALSALQEAKYNGRGAGAQEPTTTLYASTEAEFTDDEGEDVHQEALVKVTDIPASIALTLLVDFDGDEYYDWGHEMADRVFNTYIQLADALGWSASVAPDDEIDDIMTWDEFEAFVGGRKATRAIRAKAKAFKNVDFGCVLSNLKHIGDISKATKLSLADVTKMIHEPTR